MTDTEAGLHVSGDVSSRPSPPPCACCGLEATAAEMVTIAELLTREFPDIIWTSGTRCQGHNKKIGGSGTSGHLPIWGPGSRHSCALDGTMKLWNPERIRKILFRSIEHGARGIGYYPKRQSFHIDLKPRRQLWKPGPAGRLKYFFT